MAKLLISETWWSDPRREVLGRLIGSNDAADGIMLRLWVLAQSFWLKGKLIPKDIFSMIHHSQHILDAGLATIEAEGVYAVGTKDHNAWLLKMKDKCSTAGKASAKARQAKPIRDKKLAKRKTNMSSTYGNMSLTYVEPMLDQLVDTREKVTKTLGSEIWDSYADTYFRKYGIAPTRNARANALCGQLATRLGRAALDVVVFYVNHPKAFYVSKSHDLKWCVADAESLNTELQRGRPITSGDIREYEKRLDAVTLTQAIERGEV